MLDPRPAYLVPDRVRRLHPNRRSPWLANDLCIGRTRAARRMRPTMNTPQRPDPSIVSSAIPMVYVGRNHDGLWVALDADSGIGGLFLFKSGALRFGHRRRNGRLSATMEMTELELPGRNRGNPLAGSFAAAMHVAARVIAKVAAAFGAWTRDRFRDRPQRARRSMGKISGDEPAWIVPMSSKPWRW